MLLMPALRSLCEGDLSHRVSFRTAKATQRKLALKN